MNNLTWYAHVCWVGFIFWWLSPHNVKTHYVSVWFLCLWWWFKAATAFCPKRKLALKRIVMEAVTEIYIILITTTLPVLQFYIPNKVTRIVKNVKRWKLLHTVNDVAYIRYTLLHDFHFGTYLEVMSAPGIHPSPCSPSLLNISMTGTFKGRKLLSPLSTPVKFCLLHMSGGGGVQTKFW